MMSHVCDRQKLLENHSNTNANIDPRAFLILDDCINDNDWIKDLNISSLFMKRRQYNIMIMVTMQYPLGIPSNYIDYVFILPENNLAKRRRIFDSYAGMFSTFDMFCNGPMHGKSRMHCDSNEC